MQTVLLVDDDRRVSSAYLRVLQDLNVKVFIASAMSEAQEIAKTCQDISVVITDYRLPDGDGLSLIKNIREICIKRECLQFILITGHANVSVAQRAIELGVRQLVTKPIRREALINVVNSALLVADTIEREKKSEEIIASTLAEVEFKLGAISRKARVRDGAGKENKNYQDRLINLLERELDRKARISRELISDSEWVFLLQVAVAEFDEKPITLKDAAHCLGIPLSSLIRKANTLCERALLERWDDPSDARRSFLRLTPRAQDTIQKIIGFSHELKVMEEPCTD